jgi:inner membrane transporter RhtA
VRSQTRTADRIPPQSYFLVSAVFHYLGPSLAVLLFAQVSVLGVAWLRIVTAAVVFAVWRRPWRMARRLTGRQRWVLVALGAVLAAMNCLFYLAVDRLPLSTVGAIEFLGTVLLAALGARTRRNAAALVLTTAGVAAITEIRLTGQPLGFVFAFANCLLFMVYVVLGHRIANTGDREGPQRAAGMSGIDQLGASMLLAAVAVTPVGLGGALPSFSQPMLLLAGAGVGICSSVIPYITDQLAMARLPRATFALMMALLPMFATLIGAIVLHQIPTAGDLAGIALVIAGVALHQAGGTARHELSGPGQEQRRARRPQKRSNHGIRAARLVGPDRVADRPGHDELRRRGGAEMGAAGGTGGADRAPGGGGRGHLL